MKILSHFLYLFLLFSISCSDAVLDAAALAGDRESSSCIRKEVHDVSAIREHATREGRGVFFLDADDVLFTNKYDEGLEAVCTVRLYPNLEDLIREIKAEGHRVVIMTYNFADTIRKKLQEIDLEESLFDGILSCEMKGDIMTAKGHLLRNFITDNHFDFGVFIDNFPPFVEDVERMAKELAFQLYSFVSTGYIELYYRYVYYRLSTLYDKRRAGDDVSEEISQIAEGLAMHHIDITSFKAFYPTAESFQEGVRGLIWPYLTYK